jgi:hypothetical protein
MSKPVKVTFSKFESTDTREFAEAQVFVDGKEVGTICRCNDSVFVTATSRARKWVVSRYEVVFNSGLSHDDVEVYVSKTTDAKTALKVVKEKVAALFTSTAVAA